MQGTAGPSGRRVLPLALGLLGQCALLLAGALLLRLGASPGWLLGLLALSLANVAIAAGLLAPRRAAQAAAEDALPAAACSPRQLQRRLQQLEEELARGEQRMAQLAATRDHAREGSRLKSDYLLLLSREMRPLRQQAQSLLRSAESDEQRQRLAELERRLGDIDALLGGIAGTDTSASAARHQRVLIVDDGPVNLMLACQVLERHGAEVQTATSGDEALKLLEQGPFGLVLMDIFMPGMDGMETCRRWRRLEQQRYPGHRSILMAMTAHAEAAATQGREQLLAAGFDDYLAKPYRPQQLIDLVERWLPPPDKDASPS